jgi:hypothetical protein
VPRPINDIEIVKPYFCLSTGTKVYEDLQDGIRRDNHCKALAVTVSVREIQLGSSNEDLRWLNRLELRQRGQSVGLRPRVLGRWNERPQFAHTSVSISGSVGGAVRWRCLLGEDPSSGLGGHRGARQRDPMGNAGPSLNRFPGNNMTPRYGFVE